LNVLGVNDVRQTEIHIAEPLVPEPSDFKVEMAIEKLERYYVILTVHSIAIGGYLFIIPTYAQFLQYYYFTRIRISAFRMPSSGGHTVKSIDYTSIV
jgi:hypothetical protein